MISGIVAAHFGIPFYIAAPFTTIDLECESGECIGRVSQVRIDVHSTHCTQPYSNQVNDSFWVAENDCRIQDYDKNDKMR